MERRIADIELRAEGRRLIGTVLRFGDVSSTHRERFAPDSLRMAESVHLDLHHDPMIAVAWAPDGGLELRFDDDGVHLDATLPPLPAADLALDEVRSGKSTGLSLEFRCLKDTREAGTGIRVIGEALITGIGIVRAPSYANSRVEARARRRRVWL